MEFFDICFYGSLIVSILLVIFSIIISKKKPLLKGRIAVIYIIFIIFLAIYLAIGGYNKIIYLGSVSYTRTPSNLENMMSSLCYYMQFYIIFFIYFIFALIRCKKKNNIKVFSKKIYIIFGIIIVLFSILLEVFIYIFYDKLEYSEYHPVINYYDDLYEYKIDIHSDKIIVNNYKVIFCVQAPCDPIKVDSYSLYFDKKYMKYINDYFKPVDFDKCPACYDKLEYNYYSINSIDEETKKIILAIIDKNESYMDDLFDHKIVD